MFEDDGRVAYAYLLDGAQIVNDVWLYNQSATPLVSARDTPGELPFLNSEPFVNRAQYPPISDADYIRVDWPISGREALQKVELYLREQAGEKDGPLAKVLTSELSAG